MSYIKSYVLAVLGIAAPLGIVVIVETSIRGNPLSLYCLWLSLVAGMAGPVGIFIKNGRKC